MDLLIPFLILVLVASALFIAAKTVRDRSVSRAQTLLAFHGGIRGSIAGAASPGFGALWP